VPDAKYTLTRSRGNVVLSGRAGDSGVLLVSDLPGPQPIVGGDRLTLRNAVRRVLTTLHVAHLRVAIDGEESVLASGTCQPGDYWGAPVTKEPSSSEVGEPGSTGLGSICPASGSAKGLADSAIAQTDDLSGGLTETSVPLLEGEIPAPDATLYGAFTALAQTGVPTANGGTVPAAASVSLTISPAGSSQVVWHAGNVALAKGVTVRGLAAGVYSATWVLRDANGDTRTAQTAFVESR
jgi:hypothetical protein